jgi:hypothetical protein
MHVGRNEIYASFSSTVERYVWFTYLIKEVTGSPCENMEGY